MPPTWATLLEGQRELRSVKPTTSMNPMVTCNHVVERHLFSNYTQGTLHLKKNNPQTRLILLKIVLSACLGCKEQKMHI